MSQRARVFRVMIASPGDTEKERQAAEKIIYDWNVANYPTSNIVLLPIRYEVNTPLGESAIDMQEIIDKYLTSQSDMVIGIFKTKLGRNYSEFLTYTLHEIREHVHTKRLAMIFMYSGNYPSNIDPIDLKHLREFQNNMNDYLGSACLYRPFRNINQFRQLLTRDLQLAVNTHFLPLVPGNDEIDFSIASKSNCIQFFCQDNRPPKTAFFEMIKRTKKFYFMARTGVTFMARYSIRMRQALDEGCEIRFLIVNPESEIIKCGRGDNPFDKSNAEHSLSFIKDLKKYRPEKVEVKLSEYYPTFDIEFFEYDNGEKYLLMQTHFIAGHLGPDRPMFVLSEKNPWYHIFWDEYIGMWNMKQNITVD